MTTEPFADDLVGRRVRMDGYGDTSVLYLDEASAVPIGPGQVVVRVRTTGINPGEAKIRDGSLQQVFPSTFPQGQGSDLAGVIAAIGSDVAADMPGGAESAPFAVGDEVLGWTDGRAAQADYVTLDLDTVVAKPAGLDWPAAGALHVAGTTAVAAVRAVALSQGDTVAISGASGGVGHLAVQLARRQGARVIAIAGADSADWLRGYGAEPVAYGDGLADRLRALTPDGIDAFIDTSGAGYVEIAVGLGVSPQRINTIADFAALETYDVKSEGSAFASTPEVMAELAGLVGDGAVEVRIVSTYPLEQVAEAYAELEQGHTHGKIVLDLTMSPAG